MLIPHGIAGFSRDDVILITGAQVVMISHAVVMRYTDMVGRWRSWEPVGQQEYVEKMVEG